MRTSGEQIHDSEDESEILEESPCGRWLKRREEVQQRDVPGIDAAYLALDTEEGFEVVWNEVRFSERKKFKAQEEKLRDIFENLVRLDHPNIVKFHKYWIDNRDDKPRVIFITEYMSSGSLKQFLKRTKRNVKKPPLQAWKRWCTQILSALNFLHSCTPPIIHGNLSCDTIFIQHNGLIKIGCVAPDAIHQHVKTCKDSLKNTHFIAPEFGMSISPAVDIYSFGVCALEMAALEIQGNGDSGSLVTEEHIWRTLETLEGISQRDLIRACLHEDPSKRPSARELLFHPTLFEVPSLKLLAAHVVVHHSANVSEIIGSSGTHRFYTAGVVIAEIRKNQDVSFCYSLRDVPAAEKVDKYVEDVKFGIYPLSVFEVQTPSFPASRAVTPDLLAPPPHAESPEPVESEKRRVVSMACSVSRREGGQGFQMLLLLRMDDQMNRQLSCSLSERDTSKQLARELVQHGFINSMDMEKLANLMENARHECVVRDALSNQGIVEPGNFENLTAGPVNLDKNPVNLGNVMFTQAVALI